MFLLAEDGNPNITEVGIKQKSREGRVWSSVPIAETSRGLSQYLDLWSRTSIPAGMPSPGPQALLASLTACSSGMLFL